MDLSVKLSKLTLENPIICASGTFGYGIEIEDLTDFEAIGAIITKTITLRPRAGNPCPRIYETECGVMNSVGLENPGLEAFIREKLPSVAKLKCKKIISVGGFSNQEYKKIIQRLDKEKGVDAFEINLSCPNLQLKKLVSQDKKATFKVVKLLRGITQKPLFIKITPEVTDIVEIAKAAEEAGADAISAVNTFFSLAIDTETRKPYLGNVYGGYSGKAIKPMALYRVFKIAREIKIPVIGGGGIENSNDAIEFILAGARALSLGTINLVSPNSPKKILKGIKGYLKNKKINKIKDLEGGILA